LPALPAEAREVVRLVAAVPTRAELWLLEEAVRPGPSAVEAGVAAGPLVVGSEAVGFRHELLRQAVEGSLSILTRRELNRRVLWLLSEARGREVDIARLVHHARQANDAEAVPRYAPEAARQAAAVSAHREAVGHYRAALPHADRLPATERADLLESYSVEAYVSGFAQEALEARRAALRIREAEGTSPERLGESLRWLSRLSWWAGRRAEAEAAAARAIAALERGEPGHQLAMAYSNQAQLDMLAYRTEAALAWGSRAIELARRLGDQEALTHALTNIGTARLHARDLGGRSDLEQAFEAADAAGLEDHAARALVNQASCDMQYRDYRHARGDLDRAVAFTVRHDLTGNAQYMLGMRARLLLERGDWAGAELDARAALAELEQRRQGPRAVDALVVLGLLQARRGDADATATLEEAAARALPTDELQWIGLVAAARAEHAWLHGALDRTATEAAMGFGLAVRAGHPWFAGELACWLWRADALPEVPAVVAEPYRLLLAGDWRGSADAWQALGCPYEQAQALALGDEEACLRVLGLLDGLGARQTALRLRRRLRGRGNLRVPRGPTRATAANPAGLTGRQVEVLGLLAEGLTDAEIAARLSLSTKTVGHHVSALLAKLAIGSRRQAAAAAHRLGIAAVKDGEPGDEN
jgi:DNA-binding CsgD family transcriptional regulator/tetratricopeptide (TPR) repeat protein